MTVLTKEAILAADDARYEIIDVPEWGGKVRIRGLSGDERDRYEQSMVAMVGSNITAKLAGATSRLVAWSLVDDDGKRLFTDTEVKALGAKSAQALQRVFDAARHLSGLTKEDVESMVGNSESVPSDGSTSS